MSSRPPVRIPSAREDAPALVRAAVTGLVAFVVGAVLARTSLDRDLVHEAGRGASTRAAATRSATGPDAGTGAITPPPLGDAVAEAGAPTPPPDAATTPDDIVPAPAETAIPEEPATPPDSAVAEASIASPTPTATGDAAVVHGRIAYIRCDGVPPVAGPVPCPRDLSMERAVWSVIDRLPARCAALGGARGAADVRVVFDGARVSGLGFRDLPSPALPAETVRACLEPALGAVTQSLGATRLTASFRFELR